MLNPILIDYIKMGSLGIITKSSSVTLRGAITVSQY